MKWRAGRPPRRLKGEAKLRYRFENFVLDVDRRELRREDGVRQLEPQVFDLLAYLIRHRERVVSKDDILAVVWNGRIVSDAAIASRIKSARAAIDDDGDNQRLIRTVARRGFRFTADVREEHYGVSSSVANAEIPLHDRPSLAVLPFNNLSADPTQDYFADGIVEDITTALSQFRELVVIARNSSFAFKGRSVPIPTIGRELGARYVLEGSVRQMGGRVRVTGQLIDAASGGHLWADRFDGSLSDIFELQDQVTLDVAGALAPTLERAEIERTRRKPTDNLDAYDHYLRGVAASYQMSRAKCDEALKFFETATEIDPYFAGPYARSAQLYVLRKANGWMRDYRRESADAVQIARKALELGRSDAASLSYGGYALAYVGGELEAGDGFIDLALTLNRNMANAWGASGWMKTCLGDYTIGIERAEYAIRLSPLDPRKFAWQFCIALAHLLAGRFETAAGWAERSLHNQPNYLSPLRVAAASYALAGRLGEAEIALKRLRSLDPAARLSNLVAVLPPIRKEKDREVYITGLRAAGLPE